MFSPRINYLLVKMGARADERDMCEIPLDYAGLSEDEATEFLMIMQRVDAIEARRRVISARGGSIDDVIAIED